MIMYVLLYALAIFDPTVPDKRQFASTYTLDECMEKAGQLQRRVVRGTYYCQSEAEFNQRKVIK